MRAVNPAAQAVREERLGVIEKSLVWISSTDRETNVALGIGIWTGDDDETIEVLDHFRGVTQNRLFYGGGELLDVGAVRDEAGLDFTSVNLTISSLGPAAATIFRVQEPRGAEVQIWKRSYRLASRRPVAGLPEIWFAGFVDPIDIVTPAVGGEALMTVEVVSTARLLTLTSAAKKSHEVQKARVPGDTFRRYKAVTADTEVPWGEKNREAQQGMRPRLPDWSARLTDYIARSTREPFRYGEHDCALFVAGAIEAMTGEDIAAAFRGTYADLAGGLKAVMRAGFMGPVDYFHSLLQHIPVANAAVGDVAVVFTAEGPAFGVVQGPRIYLLSQSSGIVTYDLLDARAAFRVP